MSCEQKRPRVNTSTSSVDAQTSLDSESVLRNDIDRAPLIKAVQERHERDLKQRKEEHDELQRAYELDEHDEDDKRTEKKLRRMLKSIEERIPKPYNCEECAKDGRLDHDFDDLSSDGYMCHSCICAKCGFERWRCADCTN